MEPDVEVVFVPTEDFDAKVARLIAQLLTIDETPAQQETSEVKESAA